MHERNDEDVAIGRHITGERLLCGLTQQDLADRLGWPVSTLGNYESGRRALRVSHLTAIARALGRPPAALLATDPSEAAVIERISRSHERAKQVLLFLDSLDDDAASA
ncbi:MAG: helix-turn-helix transcriptional regulator [Chloroflexales bacterium]